MKKLTAVCALVLALTMALAPAAHAAEWADPTQVCYPSSVTQSEDGTEIRKFYDLSPEDDPTGIPRSDFEQDGYHYTWWICSSRNFRSMRAASTPRR